MLSNYYPPAGDSGFDTTSPESACDPNTKHYWNNVEVAPWMASDMHHHHPSMLDGQYTNGWDHHQQIPVTSAAPGAQTWPVDYSGLPTPDHTHHISAGHSPADDYFGGAVDSSNSLSTSYPETSWDQPLYSPYSQVPPAGLPAPSQSIPYSSSSTSPKTSKMSASPPSSKSSTSKSKSSSKSKPSKPTSSTSSKRKSAPSSTSKPPPASTNAPQEIHRIASEHISREAWRICRAEAVEMEARRVALLQHGIASELEREMAAQRRELASIRQGVMREQRVLEEALRMAEGLGTSR